MSVLAEVDFELDLLHKDLIDRRYILGLLRALKGATDEQEYKDYEQSILSALNTDPQLFSKRELIQKFIDENLPTLTDEDAVDNGFDEFWNKEKELASQKICEDESLVSDRFKELVERNARDNRLPLRDELLETLESPPGILGRDSAYQRIKERFTGFVETFYQGMH